MKPVISDSILYIGADDHDIDLFENQYPVPDGVSYNSYLILDEKVAVMDTVDRRRTETWFDALTKALNGRDPDYLIISHMEPDHAYNIGLLAEKYPQMKLVGNAKTFAMLPRFFDASLTGRAVTVADGDSLPLGRHTLTFYTAPMVHWPEVMVSYESEEKLLFSADAFGRFGALDVDMPWLDEARRYYQTACQLDPGDVEYRQALNFVENSAGGYRPEGYEVFSSGCGGDNMCGRLACTYLLCNLCGCGGMRFFWC